MGVWKAAWLLLAVSWIGVAACAQELPEGATQPATIRVGVLPDESDASLRSRYVPLLEYLSEATSIPHELRVPESYDHLLEWFAAREVELAWFGGLTFVRARVASGAEALVMRDIDRHFTSEFVVAGTSQARDVEELRGGVFAFGPRLSTSGHLMPRYFLGRRGVDPEEFFAQVRYSRGHDETVYWVRDGLADIGVANSAIVASMYADGRISRGSVRRLEATAPFHNYTWAVQPGLPREIVLRIRDGFLALDPDDPSQARILSAVGASGFVPAAIEDFAAVRETALLLGLAAP